MVDVKTVAPRRDLPHHRLDIPLPEIRQAAAICLRAAPGHGGIEVLLVTSRSTGAWGLPKGHIEAGETSWETARREVFEEAGVLGEPDEAVLGMFRYRKPGRHADYRVAVHLLATSQVLARFPEQGRRKSQWVPVDMAGQMVGNLHIAGLLDFVFHFSALKAHSGRCLLDSIGNKALRQTSGSERDTARAVPYAQIPTIHTSDNLSPV